MKIPEVFRRKKRRKYPVMRDEYGKSARSRCFEMFADKTLLSEIAKELGVKIETVHRYHLQWKKDPDFERGYSYVKGLFKKTAPDRDKNIELFAKAYQIPKEQFEAILSQPHGLRRLMTGKFYFPGHADDGHKRYVVMEVAMTISDHLDNNGGQLEDVLFAFRRWMQENKEIREEEDADIKEENKTTAFTHRVLEAAVKQEQEGRVKLDRLSVEERDAILRYGIDARWRETETVYWQRIAILMAEGLTPAQAREKIYQDLVETGDVESGKMVRSYQDKVHPLKASHQPLPTPPPEPSSPT